MHFRESSLIRWVLSLDRKDKFDLAHSATFPPSWDDLGLNLKELNFHKGAGYGIPELKKLIADRNSVTPEQVLIGLGTSGVNALIYLSLLEPKDQVIIERPYYEPLVRLAQMMNVEIRYWDRKPEDEFRLNTNTLEDLITPKTRLVVVSNLHNPSMTYTEPEKLGWLGAKVASEGAYLLCDEVYSEFIPKYISAGYYGQSVIATSSLSKILDLGGTRTGWAIAPLAIVERCERLAEIFYGELSLLSQTITLAAFKKLDELKKPRLDAAQQGIEIVSNWIQQNNKLGFSWVKPHWGSVAFNKIPPKINDMALMECLLKNSKTIITPGSYFAAPGYIRISFVKPIDVLKTGLANISGAVQELSQVNN
jgi:aspartate/methionine/tyrosine aminotransferase